MGFDAVEEQESYTIVDSNVSEESEDKKSDYIDKYLTKNDIAHTNILENYDKLDSPGNDSDVAYSFMYSKCYEMVCMIIRRADRDEEDDVANEWRSVKNDMEEFLHPEKVKGYRERARRLNRTPIGLKRTLNGRRQGVQNFISIVMSGTQVTTEKKSDEQDYEGF